MALSSDMVNCYFIKGVVDQALVRKMEQLLQKVFVLARNLNEEKKQPVYQQMSSEQKMQHTSFMREIEELELEIIKKLRRLNGEQHIVHEINSFNLCGEMIDMYVLCSAMVRVEEGFVDSDDLLDWESFWREASYTQMDFIIFTKWHIYVINSENYFCDIEVQKSGDFKLRFEERDNDIEEGLVKKNDILMADIANIFEKEYPNRFQPENRHSIFQSYIVVANTDWELSFASDVGEKIKDQVIPLDKLCRSIKRKEKEQEKIKNRTAFTREEMYDYIMKLCSQDARSPQVKAEECYLDYAYRFSELEHICPLCGGKLEIDDDRTVLKCIGKSNTNDSDSSRCQYMRHL